MNAIKKEIARALKNKGGTLVNGKLWEFNSGYSVGIGNINIIETNKIHGEENIINMVSTIIERSNNKIIGLWVNEGLIYIDVVMIEETRDKAIALAKMNGELAIWDNANKKEIQIKKEGK